MPRSAAKGLKIKVKATKAWAVVDGNGGVLPNTVGDTMSEAEARIWDFSGKRTIPVLITPIVKRKKSKKGK